MSPQYEHPTPVVELRGRPSFTHGLFTLPNQLTAARFVLAVVFFAVVTFSAWLWALAIFLVAALTDWLDGYLARRSGQVTTLGRILDPFVDKIIICGAFIFLLPVSGAGLSAWMVTVLVGRELLVTLLRSLVEREGRPFGASWEGKLKMVLQCTTVGWILFHLGAIVPASDVDFARLSAWVRDILIWITVLSTLASGIAYTIRAASILRSDEVS